MAQKIIDAAEKSGIPVFRDNTLATLLSQLQSGTEIPQELYQAVVDIYIYFLGYHTDKDEKAVQKKASVAAVSAVVPIEKSESKASKAEKSTKLKP